MTKINKETLGYLGVEFQYKLIKSFMDEPKFFRDIFNAVNQNMFTEPQMKKWVGIMRDYYNKYEIVPSYNIMEIKIREKVFDERDLDMSIAFIDKLKNTTSEGVDEIKDLATKFFKQQAWVKLANDILLIASRGDHDSYEQCADKVGELLTIGESDDDMGCSPLDNLDEVLSDEHRMVIPTGIGRIDEILEGGIAKQELGIIIGPTSFGKTSLTTAMASFASTYECKANNYEGFKVLQIVFEDRPRQIQRKHIGRLTNIEAKDLSKPQFIDQVKDNLKNNPNIEKVNKNIKIKKYVSGETTVRHIKQGIKKYINKGFRPDLVIIDYFECIEHEHDKTKGRQEEWSKEGVTMRKIEAMAEEFNIAIWVPTQGNKDSIGSEIVTMDKAGGSIKKIQIGHMIMSIARSNEDMQNNKASIGILKNRAGKAGEFIRGVDFNNGTCIISTDGVISYDDAISYKDDEQRRMVRDTINMGKNIFEKNEVK